MFSSSRNLCIQRICRPESVLHPTGRSFARPVRTNVTTSSGSANAGASKSPFWRVAGGGAALALAGSVTYTSMDFFGGSEGLYRAVSFYSLAIPTYVRYRLHQAVFQSPQETWDALDRETSQKGLDKILSLRGFYIKCGQMAAANVGNGFPEIWQRKMSVLQDQCPPVDYTTTILPILQDAYRSSMKFPLSSIDPAPLGTASIGQVHSGKLVANGTPVVVKVCLPHAERLLRGDVRTILAFCQVAQPVHVPSLRQVEEQLVENELDYRKEAAQLNRVRENMRGLPCLVPKAYPEYCTQHVLVMEELKGQKLVDALREDGEKWKTLGTKYGFPTDDQGGDGTQHNVDAGTALQGLESQRRIRNAAALLYNMTAGWVAPSLPYSNKEDIPLDHSKLVDDLFYIHGHQVLVDGRFNADCHPEHDGSPILGLIDYGQVKVLTKEERLRLCKIIIALDEENRDEVTRLMIEAGFQSKKMNPEVIWLYSKVNYDEDNAELTNGLHIQMFMEELQNRDPIIDLPEPYLMVSRASILLRGLAHSLKQSRSVAKEWRPIAERVLQGEENSK